MGGLREGYNIYQSAQSSVLEAAFSAGGGMKGSRENVDTQR